MSLMQERSHDATYQRHLRQGTLTFQECGGGHAFFPPRPMCPRCGDRELTWRPSAGEAIIYSATTISPRGAEPYTVVILDVAEGFRIMSRIDGAAATAAAIGDRVRIVIRALTGDGDPLPLTEPANGGLA